MNQRTCEAACRIYGHAAIPDGLHWQCIRCLTHIRSIIKIHCAYFVLGQWWIVPSQEWRPRRIAAPPFADEQMLAAVIEKQKANFRNSYEMEARKFARSDACFGAY
jgi:hypothetical protein